MRAGNPDPAPDLFNRRTMVTGALAGAASTLMPRFSQGGENAFKFGLTPVFLSNDLELLGHFRAYLAHQLGSPVELVSRRTYQEITSLLVSGQLHAAWICGYPYVQYRADLDLVATPSWRGKPLYQSYLIARAGRTVNDWTALRGDVHAFSDPNSNSGYLVTKALLAENRLHPEQFFSRSFFTYGHRNVIRAVASGLAQSGSVDGYVWEVVREVEPGLVGKTLIVRKSEWLGFPPVASPKSLAGDPRVIALRGALVSMREDSEGKQVLDMLRLDGFVETSPSCSNSIAAKVEAVKEFG